MRLFSDHSQRAEVHVTAELLHFLLRHPYHALGVELTLVWSLKNCAQLSVHSFGVLVFHRNELVYLRSFQFVVFKLVIILGPHHFVLHSIIQAYFLVQRLRLSSLPGM